MSKSVLVQIGCIAVVAVVSIVLVYFRSESMAQLDVLAKRGLKVIQRENVIYFGLVMPIAIGLISRYVYNRWYVGQPMSFLYLAIGIGVGLSVLAAIFYKRAFIDFSILHILHIAVFGWFMPTLLK